MVYYFTSENIKIIRNILLDYSTTSDLAPTEYMNIYISKCPEAIEEDKVKWIAKTFLGLQKHSLFLRSIASHLNEELSEENQDYFAIVFYAIIYQIAPDDKQKLYKCLFNINKSLLNTFTKFLSNNEVLTYISQVAQANYDAKYITDEIIAPLFTWQPYISEIGHSYEEYVQKTENRKIKPKTIPITPNVLNRKPKVTKSPAVSAQNFSALTPPNSVNVKKSKKITKNDIDEKLKIAHERNVQKATHLLNEVKNNEHHYAKIKTPITETEYPHHNHTRYVILKPKQKILPKHSEPLPVKETATTLKRLNKVVQSTAQNEVQWLTDLLKSCKLSGLAEELLEHDRKETEKERLLEIERKHVMGLLSHEEAYIAKNRVIEDNKKKYEEFLKEKEKWNEEIEKWKINEMDKNRKLIEQTSLNELKLIHSKNEVVVKNKVLVESVKKETEMLLKQSLKKKQEELERRITMIKEIKLLALLSKKSRAPKIIDLTETPGFGFLCEMSMAELQERLSSIKMCLQDELEQKKTLIKQEHLAAKQELEETKLSIKTFMAERASFRKKPKKQEHVVNTTSSREIDDLKKVLEEKRKLRKQLSS